MGDHDPGNLQWSHYLYRVGDFGIAAPNAFQRGLQDRYRHVADLHDRHGASDELGGCGGHRRRHADAAGNTADAASRLSGSTALQLLAVKGLGQGVPLIRRLRQALRVTFTGMCV